MKSKGNCFLLDYYGIYYYYFFINNNNEEDITKSDASKIFFDKNYFISKTLFNRKQE